MNDIPVIHIAKDFSKWLSNGNIHHGDGKHTAVEFRERFLHSLDFIVILDFENVQHITPSFANEAFTYFKQKMSVNEIKNKILFRNVSAVQKTIIEMELDSDYNKCCD